MNGKQLFEKLGIDSSLLQSKKSQTDYKIKYVKEYIATWVNISARRDNITNINFIDCMCNAGIYADGDFCTAIEVLKIFRDMSFQFPYKQFNLFVNDINSERTAIIELLSKEILGKSVKNVTVSISNMDVNTYLTNFQLFDKKVAYNAMTVLFVDPYDFGTVHISAIQAFIQKYNYCEVVFNVFTSDFVRNGIDHRIKECIGEVKLANKEELIEFIAAALKKGAMKYSFSYRFFTRTNAELYQIFFITPNIKGLEVLKEALWKVFNGQFYHKNKPTDSGMQLSIFGEADDKALMESMHSQTAQNLLIEKFTGRILHYNTLECFLMERSMLKASQVINLVIKPLMECHRIKKVGNVSRANNYKEDSYEILG